jgi:hypothetical protein
MFARPQEGLCLRRGWERCDDRIASVPNMQMSTAIG